MGRIYHVPITATAFTVAIDACEILASAAKAFVLHEIVLGQSTEAGDAAAEILQVLIKRGIGNTSGSGGATITPAKSLTNDAAAGPTAEIMNTTQAVAGGGSLTTLRTESWNVQGGFQYLPPPEDRITFIAAEMLVISVTVPLDSITMFGTVVIEEL